MNNRQNGIYEIPEEWKNDPGVRRCLEVIKNREERILRSIDEELRKQKEDKKDELETRMLEDLDFLFEDLSDDGDGELQLTEEGKRVYEFIIKFIQ